jgi:hypothetical protein
MEKLSVSPAFSSAVLKSSAECFPALHFVKALPPKKQMLLKKQKVTVILPSQKGHKLCLV